MSAKCFRLQLAVVVPVSYEAQIEGAEDKPRQWDVVRREDVEKALQKQLQRLKEHWYKRSDGRLDIIYRVQLPKTRVVPLKKRGGGTVSIREDMLRELARVRSLKGWLVCATWIVLPEDVFLARLSPKQQAPNYDRQRRRMWFPCTECQIVSGCRQDALMHEFKHALCDLLLYQDAIDSLRKRFPAIPEWPASCG